MLSRRPHEDGSAAERTKRAPRAHDVGALVVDGSVQCSGVLVAPTVFATAGHCGVDGSRVSVSFDSKLGDGWTLQQGTLEVDPGKGADLAVVVLDAPAGVAPAALTLGVPALLLIRAVAEGATTWGLVWGAAGAVWIGALLRAAIRDRETRGWLVFALIGWVSYIRPLLRRLVVAARR